MGNNVDEVKEFLKEISEFMPQRPSRASTEKKDKPLSVKRKTVLKKKPESNKVVKEEKDQAPVSKKEEIWLL